MKLLIIGFVWPEPNSSAAGSRMLQLIDAFQIGHQITFASAAAESEHAFDLDVLGIQIEKIQLNHSSFDTFITQLQPDIVMFDRFMTEEQFGWRVAEHCPDALRILDTEDLQSLRKTRQACHGANEEFTINKWLQANITKREIASIYRCDLSLIISSYELELLQEVLKIEGTLLHYVPFMLDELIKPDIEKLPLFIERQHFVTIGNSRHEPNYDSLLYLKDTIWPVIKKQLPKTEMHVYGSYPMQKVMQLHNESEGFLIKGWVKDAEEALQNAKVCLAPLRFGAGIKGKFVMAMQNGTPSVTTPIGAEGFLGGFGGFVVEESSQIAEKAIELYSNESCWREKQQIGFDLINREFNRTALQKELLTCIEETRKNLENLRLENFTGAMLYHHTLQSTKYLSKWIEKKHNQRSP